MSVTLGYWGIRGAGQVSRWVAEYLALPYEDKRYTDHAEWFGKDKPAQPANPLINLPYLQDGDKYVYESQAIPIYLVFKAGKQAELLPQTQCQHVLSAQGRGVLQDIQQAFFKNIQFIPKAEYEANGKTIFVEKVLPLFKKLDAWLGGRQFASGDSLSLGDFYLYEVEDMLRCFCADSFNALPNLVAHFNLISELPAIKAYRASPRFQERPFMPTTFANWG